MNSFAGKRALWLSIAIFIFLNGVTALAQVTSSGPATKPLLQDIKVYSGEDSPASGSTPYVKKTSSVEPAVVKANSPYPGLADVAIPGYTGILVESMDGTNIVEIGSNITFNPASNVKIATAYAVLKTFGPDYRFSTNVWTDGSIDTATGTLQGNLYVSGRDPIFTYEHAVAIANELNRLGIRTVSGDLIVTDDFAMNYSSSTLRSGQSLLATMDSAKRSATATRSWFSYLSNAGRYGQVPEIPGVTFTGSVYVQPMPSTLRLLFSHESAPMREIVKATLCYSNNFLAERLGDMLGGVDVLVHELQEQVLVLLGAI